MNKVSKNEAKEMINAASIANTNDAIYIVKKLAKSEWVNIDSKYVNEFNYLDLLNEANNKIECETKPINMIDKNMIEDIAQVMSKYNNNEVDEKEIRNLISNEVNPIRKDIEDIKDLMSSNSTNTKRLPVKVEAKNNSIVDAMVDYYIPEKENITNLLLLSPPSFGKSHGVRIIAKAYKNFVEHNCSEDPEEIDNLIGSVKPDPSNGKFLVIDGKLTEAVRAASNNEPTLILFDEVLRWNDTTQSFMLTFLAGFDKNINGNLEQWYKLTTKNSVNGKMEVIECSAKYLHIVGAANLTNIIPVQAFYSRWEPKRFSFTEDFCKYTAKSILDRFSNTMDQIEIEKLIDIVYCLIKVTRENVVNGSLEMPVDFRYFKRALSNSDGSFKNICHNLKSKLIDNCSNWNPDTGETEKDSIEACNGIVTAIEVVENK